MRYILSFLLIPFLPLCAFGGGIYNIIDFGAVSGNGTLQTIPIQAAIDSAERAGGGTVLIPQGVFLTSTLFLKDNVILEIAKNGTLKGASKVNQYPDVIPTLRSFTDRYPQRSMIFAEGKKNIGIRGEGTLDGNGLSLDFVLNSDDKPFGVRFISCTNVLYEGITMKNSGFWMMHNLNCDSLTIRNLKLTNHNFGNGDGVNIDGSRHVLVENCIIDSNDDPLVIKTTNLAAAENIVVRNCTFATYSRAIKVGTETYGPVRNVHIHDCAVKYSTAGPFGDRFPADCGIQLSIVDGGEMDNILVENIQIKGVQTPIFIRLGDRGEPFQEGGPRPPMGSLKNVVVRNITAEATSNITSSVTGIPGFPVRGITLQHIELTVPGGEGPVPDGYIVPENINSKPAFDMFGEYLPAYGLFIRHADSLIVENVCVTTKSPDLRPEWFWEDTSLVEALPCIISGIALPLSDIAIIYPNPAGDRLFFSLKKPGNKPGHYVITDVAGAKILVGKLSGSFGSIDVSKLPSGMYFFSWYDDMQKTATGKFIKQ